MPKLNDHLSLLMGNLWQPDEEKIQKLREQYPDIAKPQINTKLRQITEVKPSSIPEQSTIANLSETVNIAPLPVNQDKLQTTQASHTSTPPQESIVKTPLPVQPFSYNNWDELVNQALNCEKCKLCYGRTHVVIERGNRNAKWMFVGEGPGEQEDLQGKPFVGASGQLLDKMIQAMNLDSQNDVYIANVVKCRPPHNRNPEVEEIAACSNYLFSQIALVKPSLIITLGRYAAQTLLNTDLAVGKLRNKVHNYQDIPLIVTYHPSYLLRTPAAKKDAWADLQLAMRTFAQK